MIRIHTILLGQPQTITDERGEWRSSIFRTPVAGPVALQQRGLDGDQVTETAYHGSLDQAVCCHLLDHYAYWNAVYGLDSPETMLGPGSVGENWTLSDATESDICIGDTYAVGSARVQVSGPRYPCTKQERKLKLPQFHRRTIETLRTGFYLRVLTPGIVQAGDEWTLEERIYPNLTLHAINVYAHQEADAERAQELLDIPELGGVWKRVFEAQLTKQPS